MGQTQRARLGSYIASHHIISAASWHTSHTTLHHFAPSAFQAERAGRARPPSIGSAVPFNTQHATLRRSPVRLIMPRRKPSQVRLNHTLVRPWPGGPRPGPGGEEHPPPPPSASRAGRHGPMCPPHSTPPLPPPTPPTPPTLSPLSPPSRPSPSPSVHPSPPPSPPLSPSPLSPPHPI